MFGVGSYFEPILSHFNRLMEVSLQKRRKNDLTPAVLHLQIALSPNFPWLSLYFYRFVLWRS